MLDRLNGKLKLSTFLIKVLNYQIFILWPLEDVLMFDQVNKKGGGGQVVMLLLPVFPTDEVCYCAPGHRRPNSVCSFI